MAIRELKYDEINLDFDIKVSTKEVEPSFYFLGQDRVEKAFDVGLNTKSEGYNIFVAGVDGSGRTIYTKKKLEEVQKNHETPEDIVYYHNFEEPLRPKYLLLKNGFGKVLSQRIDSIIERLKKESMKVFEDKQYEDEKVKILKEAEEKRERIFETLRDEALKYNLGVIITPTGINLLPIINGKIITNIETLSDQQFEIYQSNLEKFDENFRTYLRQLREIDHTLEEALKELKKRFSNQLIDNIYFMVEEEFREDTNVINFIHYHKQKVIENIDIFVEYKLTENNPIVNKSIEQDIKLFKLNVIVDNSKVEGAPIIFETNPTFKNLFGKIAYEAYMGILFTSHMNIVAGSLHRSRGGFLVLYAKDILKNFLLWETFKRTLLTKEIAVGGNSNIDIFSLHIGIDPEHIPFNTKVIMIGDSYTYDILSEYDEEFNRIFKIKAEFNPQKNITDEDIEIFPKFIKKLTIDEDIKDVDKEGIKELLKFSVILSGNRKKINLVFNTLTDILREANTISKKDVITGGDVKEVINLRKYRINLIEEKIYELIEEGKLIIDIEGKKIGQINGLSVYSIADLQFGKPSRITASAYIGEKGIINIEREVELSGPFHSKGVLILTGFIGRKYGSDFPLTLSCSIAFEQSYGEVEGDSASAAEALAILSEIGEVPVRQDIAVTGSIDQHGNVQPVGGIKEKVEGFFRVCKILGLTGNQGVIIPSKNYDNLVLDDEVLEAVKEGKFHIYTIDSIDDAIEILSDMDYQSFHRRVKARLEEFFKNSQKVFKQR
ncbi:MAG: AAA family ATPase [Hydrogenothermaceae bacterium]